jgi:hypothetical protein
VNHGLARIAAVALVATGACDRPPPVAAPLAAPMATRTARLEMASPLDDPPKLVADIQLDPACGQPLHAFLVGYQNLWFEWLTRSLDGRVSRGFRSRSSAPDALGLWQEVSPAAVQEVDDKMPPHGCVGAPLLVAAQHASKVLFGDDPAAYAVTSVTTHLGSIRSETWLAGLAPIMSPTALAMALPDGHAVTMHSPGNLGLLPSLHAYALAFDGTDPAKRPLAVGMDYAGRIQVLDRGDRLVDIGHYGSGSGKVLMLKESDGSALTPANHLDKFAWANNGKILGSNAQHLYRVDRKSGIVTNLMDFPAAPLPELLPGGTGPCCDLVHLYDVRAGRGVFLVAPAGRPEVWVLDDGDLHLRTTWKPPVIDDKPVLAIRNLGASLSTGWLWLVAQTSPEPAYAAQVLVFRYPLPYTSGGPLDF